MYRPGGTKLKRRKFLQSLVGAVATVAIATKIAPAFPKYESRTYGTSFFWSAQEMQECEYAALGRHYHEMLMKSMSETRNACAVRVFQNFERDGLTFEGISREEFFADA